MSVERSASDHDGSFTGPELLSQEETDANTATLVEQITTAVTAAPKAAQQAARKESRRWYLLGVAAACFLSLVISFMALNLGWQEHAQRAAWAVAQQRSLANLAKVQAQIAGINTTLVQQGKPPVPMPMVPGDASARLAQAQIWLQLPKEVTPGPAGKNGAQGPEGVRGAPGPSCPNGSVLARVTFSSGQSGWGCIDSGAHVAPKPSVRTITPAPTPVPMPGQFIPGPMPGVPWQMVPR